MPDNKMLDNKKTNLKALLVHFLKLVKTTNTKDQEVLNCAIETLEKPKIIIPETSESMQQIKDCLTALANDCKGKLILPTDQELRNIPDSTPTTTPRKRIK